MTYIVFLVCQATRLVNTMLENDEIPQTTNGGTVEVECVANAEIPSGDSSYTATCVDGDWDKAFACARIGKIHDQLLNS